MSFFNRPSLAFRGVVSVGCDTRTSVGPRTLDQIRARDDAEDKGPPAKGLPRPVDAVKCRGACAGPNCRGELNWGQKPSITYMVQEEDGEKRFVMRKVYGRTGAITVADATIACFIDAHCRNAAKSTQAFQTGR